MASHKIIFVLIVQTMLVGCALAPGMRGPDTAAYNSDTDEGGGIAVYSIREIVSKSTVKAVAKKQVDAKVLPGNYRIGPGDVLGIVVWNQPKLGLSNTTNDSSPLTNFVVEADGAFYFPYAGKVKAAGMTIDEVRSKLTKRLSKVIKTPQVSVNITSYKSKRIYVLGEVETPRMIPLEGFPMTVMEAIALSGGLTEAASSSHAYILRNGQRMEVEMNKLLKDGDISQNMYLRDGDVLQIPNNSSEKVYVLGSVRQPRSVAIKGGRLSLSEALVEGGGMDPNSADAKNVYVIRGAEESPKIFHLNMEKVDALVLGERFPLQSRDVVYVASSGISDWNRVLNLLLPNIQSLFYIDALSRR